MFHLRRVRSPEVTCPFIGWVESLEMNRVRDGEESQRPVDIENPTQRGSWRDTASFRATRAVILQADLNG